MKVPNLLWKQVHGWYFELNLEKHSLAWLLASSIYNQAKKQLALPENLLIKDCFSLSRRHKAKKVCDFVCYLETVAKKKFSYYVIFYLLIFNLMNGTLFYFLLDTSSGDVTQYEKFDRIFTGIMCDVYGIQQVLQSFEPLLNDSNPFATILSFHRVWRLIVKAAGRY